MNKTTTLQHVAIIPDGNRRWAQERGLPALEGHRVGAGTTLPDLFDTVEELGIKYFTFWALSPENFVKRSETEVTNLMMLTRYYLQHKVKEIHAKNIQIRVIGDIKKLSQDIQKLIGQAIELTKNNTGVVAIFAINYGGRDEMTRAINSILKEGKKEVTKEEISRYLDTTDIPDPDLIIRTGGEKRTSGFLLWQSEYAEYDFVDTYFPDFKPQNLRDSVERFLQRQRRFGK